MKLLVPPSIALQGPVSDEASSDEATDSHLGMAICCAADGDGVCGSVPLLSVRWGCRRSVRGDPRVGSIAGLVRSWKGDSYGRGISGQRSKRADRLHVQAPSGRWNDARGHELEERASAGGLRGFAIEYKEPGGDPERRRGQRIIPSKLSTRLSPIRSSAVHFPRNAELKGDFTFTPVFMNAAGERSYGEGQEAALEVRRPSGSPPGASCRRRRSWNAMNLRARSRRSCRRKRRTA